MSLNGNWIAGQIGGGGVFWKPFCSGPQVEEAPEYLPVAAVRADWKPAPTAVDRPSDRADDHGISNLDLKVHDHVSVRDAAVVFAVRNVVREWCGVEVPEPSTKVLADLIFRAGETLPIEPESELRDPSVSADVEAGRAGIHHGPPKALPTCAAT
jgi:hypothetical protein